MRLTVFSFVLVLASCVFAQDTSSSLAERRLDTCITFYVDGEYVQAAEGITKIFAYLQKPDHILRAYRFLGYSYAMLQMTGRARTVFSAALERYPDMAVDTLEVPPRVYTVFQDVQMGKKAEWRKKYQRELVDRTIQKASAVVLLTGAGGAAFGSGYLLSSAQGSGDDISLWTGVGLGVVSAALLPVSVYLLVRSNRSPSAPFVRIESTPGGQQLVMDF